MTDQTPATPATPSTPATPAGWYPAPDGPHERWWNGAAWTEQTRPASPAQTVPPVQAIQPVQPVQPGLSSQPGFAAAPSAAASASQRLSGWIIAGTGGVIALAALLPWASVAGASVSGMDGDGVITLVLGLVILGLGIARGAGARGRGWALSVPIVALVLGTIVTLIGIVDWTQVGQVKSAMDEFGWGLVSEQLDVSVGFGLVLTTFAGLAAVGASIAALVRNR